MRLASPLVLFLALFPQFLPAQTPAGHADPKFELFKLPQEIFGNQVQSIVQDSTGFLWFGSQAGLHRYDGKKFVTYLRNELDENSLASDYIEWITIDRAGRLWLAHFGSGLTLFDPATEKFTRYRHLPRNKNSLSNDTVSVILEDPEGYIWIGTQNGLDRLDPVSGAFMHFKHNPADETSLSHPVVRALYIDKKGTLWVGCGFPWTNYPQKIQPGGLNRFRPETGTFTRYLHNPDDSGSLADNRVRAIFEDSKGRLWVGTMGDGLHWMNRETGEFSRLSYDPANPSRLSRPYLQQIPLDEQRSTGVTFIREDHNKRIWIGSMQGGLNIYDPSEGIVRHFEAGEGPGQLKTDFLWTFCQTRDGVFWIGTGGNGGMVFKSKPEKENFRFFGTNLTGADGLVMGISGAGKDRVWLGLRFSKVILGQYDRKKGKTIPYLTDKGAGNPDPVLVYSISGIPEKTVWASTFNGIFRIDPLSGKFTRYQHQPGESNSISANEVENIFQDRQGLVWLGTKGGGLDRLDPRTGKITHFRNDPGDPGSLGGNMVRWILEDRKGNIWVGGGCNCPDPKNPIFLDRFDPATGSFHHFENSGDLGCAFSLKEDKKGNIWYIDFLEGIRKLDPSSGQITRYNTLNSNLPTNSIRALEIDHQGKIWLAAAVNIVQFDPEAETFFTHQVNQHGLLETELGWGAGFVQAGSEVLFGSVGGFYAFHPHAVLSSQEDLLPKLAITGFKLGGVAVSPGTKGVLSRSITTSTEIRLASHENSFSFEVSCLDFFHPESNTIEFKLENYDQRWRKDFKDGEAVFYSVPPGKYTFRVRGANSLGIWNLEGAAVRVTILQPWWKTGWAYASYALAAIALLYGVRRIELKKQQQKLKLERQKLEQEQKVNEQLRRVDALKDQFLANTSHELRTPLLGIIGLSEYLHEQESEPDKKENLLMIVSSGKRLSSLVNDLLDFSRLKNADIELNRLPVSLHAVTDVVLRNLAPLVTGKELRLINEVPDGSFVEADENRLLQVLYNLVGNAVKFTEKGFVKVGTRSEAGSTTIFVEDTGIGIPDEKQDAIFQEFVQVDASSTRQHAGTGLGLSISKRLIELHGGTMWVESKAGSGSTFYFILPSATSQPAEPTPGGNGETILAKATPSRLPVLEPASSMAPGEVANPESADNLIRILVVDDEAVNQQVLKNHLSGFPYRITAALNGEEALHALNSGDPFDLVLLDVMMPRMSGYEVCEKIRERYLPSELPVIMVTAKNQVQDLVEGLTAGANDYLAKPFSKAEFLARVRTQLNLHRINEVTGKFVPNEFLRSLGKGNITEVVLGDHVEREVTVLFSDIRDYTALSETMSPEQNFRFVSAFNGRMGPIIQRHGGFVNQYLGDGIMAIFPGSPADALQAAVAMCRELERYNEKRAGQGRLPIRMGVGLHSGPLVMGIIGDKHRLDAATISDTVNTASRIESLSKEYGATILLSEASLSQIPGREAYHIRYLGLAQMKGKQKPVKVYECFDGNPGKVADNT